MSMLCSGWGIVVVNSIFSCDWVVLKIPGGQGCVACDH